MQKEDGNRSLIVLNPFKLTVSQRLERCFTCGIECNNREMLFISISIVVAFVPRYFCNNIFIFAYFNHLQKRTAFIFYTPPNSVMTGPDFSGFFLLCRELSKFT